MKEKVLVIGKNFACIRRAQKRIRKYAKNYKIVLVDNVEDAIKKVRKENFSGVISGIDISCFGKNCPDSPGRRIIRECINKDISCVVLSTKKCVGSDYPKTDILFPEPALAPEGTVVGEQDFKLELLKTIDAGKNDVNTWVRALMILAWMVVESEMY